MPKTIKINLDKIVLELKSEAIAVNPGDFLYLLGGVVIFPRGSKVETYFRYDVDKEVLIDPLLQMRF